MQLFSRFIKEYFSVLIMPCASTLQVVFLFSLSLTLLLVPKPPNSHLHHLKYQYSKTNNDLYLWIATTWQALFLCFHIVSSWSQIQYHYPYLIEEAIVYSRLHSEQLCNMNLSKGFSFQDWDFSISFHYDALLSSSYNLSSVRLSPTWSTQILFFVTSLFKKCSHSSFSSVVNLA